MQWLMICNKHAYPCLSFVQYARKWKKTGGILLNHHLFDSVASAKTSPVCCQHIIPFDNYADTPFVFYGMLIVFTSGHRGLFAGSCQSYRHRHVLSFLWGATVLLSLPKQTSWRFEPDSKPWERAGKECLHIRRVSSSDYIIKHTYRTEKTRRFVIAVWNEKCPLQSTGAVGDWCYADQKVLRWFVLKQHFYNGYMKI